MESLELEALEKSYNLIWCGLLMECKCRISRKKKRYVGLDGGQRTKNIVYQSVDP